MGLCFSEPAPAAEAYLPPVSRSPHVVRAGHVSARAGVSFPTSPRVTPVAGVSTRAFDDDDGGDDDGDGGGRRQHGSSSHRGSSTPLISRADLAQHNRPGDAWIAVDGRVYDVTHWAGSHPGGPHVLMPRALASHTPHTFASQTEPHGLARQIMAKMELLCSWTSTRTSMCSTRCGYVDLLEARQAWSCA